jgi:hypothetical protein
MALVDFSGLNALKGIYSSLVNVFIPILMMVFVFGIIIMIFGGGFYFLKSVLNGAVDMNGIAKRPKQYTAVKLGLVVGIILLGFAMLAVTPGSATITTGSSSCTVGVPCTVMADGLTADTDYIFIAEHSGGNQTKVITPTGTEAYVDFMFDSADSDDIVLIGYASYTGSTTVASYTDSFYLQLDEPTDYLSATFFILVLVPLVIIGIVLLLKSKFM